MFHTVVQQVVPQKTALKNGKIVRIYWKIALKFNEVCTEVVCTFHGCGLQIWPGFCLGVVYHTILTDPTI